MVATLYGYGKIVINYLSNYCKPVSFVISPLLNASNLTV